MMTSPAAVATAPRYSRVRRWATVATLLASLLIAPQARSIGALSTALGGGASGAIASSLVNSVTGLVILVLIAMLSPWGRGQMRTLYQLLRDGELSGRSWVVWTGGISGALVAAVFGLAIPILGVAVFTLAFVCGRAISGLATDYLGLGPAGVVPLTVGRILSVLVVLASVLLTVLADISVPRFSISLVLLVIGAGFCGTLQHTANGCLVQRASLIGASLLGFVITSVLLVLAALIADAGGSALGRLPGNPWDYAGGPLGLMFIVAGAWLVRLVGVLVVTVCMISGQLAGAMALDWLAPLQGHGLRPATVAGGTLGMAGVMLSLYRHQPSAADSHR